MWGFAHLLTVESVDHLLQPTSAAHRSERTVVRKVPQKGAYKLPSSQFSRKRQKCPGIVTKYPHAEHMLELFMFYR